MTNFILEKDVLHNDFLRPGFFALAKKIFDLDFEPWYKNGFWTEKYKPYTYFDGEKAVANISVNQCDFVVNGTLKHYLQLGTVMTDPEYRGQGLMRKLMEEVEKDYADKCDGFFLFANDSVLQFYPKFGFEKASEYHFEKNVSLTGECKLQQVPMENKADWTKMQEIIDASVVNSRLKFIHNSELDMFYLSQFMQENVYCIPEKNIYLVAEMEENTAVLWDVFSQDKIDMEEIIESFGEEITKVILLFTPENADGFEKVLHREEDTTLFLKGGIVKDIKEAGMFPPLCHA